MQEVKRKIVSGVVTSKIGDKSIKIVIDYKVKHPKYGKYVKRRTTIGVHDENNLAKVGDVVSVCECSPYSKTINWRLVTVDTDSDKV